MPLACIYFCIPLGIFNLIFIHVFFCRIFFNKTNSSIKNNTFHQQFTQLYPKYNYMAVIFPDVVKSTVSTWMHLRSCNQEPHYTQIRIQCVDAVVDKGEYNDFSIIHNKLITY